MDKQGARAEHGISPGSRRLGRIAAISLVPVFIYHAAVIVLPSLNTLVSSFTNWNGLARKDFLFLENYIELVKDPNFAIACMHNVVWMLYFLTIPLVLGFSGAYLLTKATRGRTVFKVGMFLPYVISAAIAGKIFAALFNPYFGINKVLEAIGLSVFARDWLAPSSSLASVAGVDIWHWWGFLMVLFISAFQQIDPMLYESAEIEGASEMQKIRYITIPGIRQTLVFMILITMVWSVNTFEYVWVMTKGGPGSELLSTMLYKNAFLKYRAGYACTIAVFQAFIAWIIFSIFALIRKRMEE